MQRLWSLSHQSIFARVWTANLRHISACLLGDPSARNSQFSSPRAALRQAPSVTAICTHSHGFRWANKAHHLRRVFFPVPQIAVIQGSPLLTCHAWGVQTYPGATRILTNRSSAYSFRERNELSSTTQSITSPVHGSHPCLLENFHSTRCSDSLVPLASLLVLLEGIVLVAVGNDLVDCQAGVEEAMASGDSGD